MDSDNSGSIQSSSGGDEEFDSRAESLSPFFSPTAGNIGSMTNPPPPHPPQNHHNSSMFDPFSNFFDPLSRASPNLDTIWSTKNARSEINPILTSVQPFFDSQPQRRSPFTSSSPPTVPFPPAAENTITPRAPSSSSSTTDLQALGVVRNPKKRSRASRRAPTTVLTTDTTNFRAMVQEFTGIPAPPFTSSPFPRTRLDLFGTSSSTRSNPLDASQPPPYLLRPFAQKFQPPPPLVSSSSSSSSSSSFLSSSIVNGTNNITSVTSTCSASNLAPPVNFQLLSDNHGLGLLKEQQQPQQGLLSMQQNPILTFQSLLQSADPKYPLANPSVLGSKPPHPLEIPSNNNHLHLKMGVLDEFGLTHTHLTALPNLVSSERTAAAAAAAATRNDDNPASWAAGGMGSDNNTEQTHLMMRSVNGNYDQRSENVAARGGEGMVESWIRSSD